jgi:hypothetical protein
LDVVASADYRAALTDVAWAPRRSGARSGDRRVALAVATAEDVAAALDAVAGSRIRQLLVGSTTTAMMRRIAGPLLLLR